MKKSVPVITGLLFLMLLGSCGSRSQASREQISTAQEEAAAMLDSASHRK